MRVANGGIAQANGAAAQNDDQARRLDDAVAQQDIDAQPVVFADAAKNGDNDVNAPNGPEQAMEHES